MKIATIGSQRYRLVRKGNLEGNRRNFSYNVLRGMVLLFPVPSWFYEVSWQWGIESPLIFFSFLYRSSFCSPYILVIILKVRYIDPFVRGSIFIKDFMSKSHRVKFVSYSYSADTTKSRIKAMDFRFINGKKEETFWLMFSLVFIFSLGRPV
jgi:hypothetical protein